MGIKTSAIRVTACMVLATSPVIAADDLPAKPRYLLSAGREYSYHNEARSVRGVDESVYKVDWKIWAVGREPDGAWKLVIRCDLRTKRQTPGRQAGQEPVDTLVWRCRMYEDGRLVGAKTMGTVRDPFRIFPRLPASPDERGHGWDSEGSAMIGATLHHRLTQGPDDGGQILSITTRSEGPEDKVYLLSHEYRATFDGRRGVVTRVETEDTNEARSGITRGTIELVAIEDRGEEWAASFGREADRYFGAVEAYGSARKQAKRDAPRCMELLAGAKSRLVEARNHLTTPVFLDAVGQLIAQHDRSVKSISERAKDLASRLGKEAEGWEATDIEGKTHRLADYRGKVVVMDFWYRGCGWCMHAMPQVNRISEAFRSEPVAVLGMTIDKG